MTDKERCDKCEFYEGPPQSDEKGVERPINAFGRPGQTVQPTFNSELGTCHAAPSYSRPASMPGKKKWPKVEADDWCGIFKERSRGTEARAGG